MSTQPTDAELKAMWQLHAADIGGIFCYARAVLAKWGQPTPATQQAGEMEVFGLQWPGEDRINLSTVFDTETEALEYMQNRCDTPGIRLVRFSSNAPTAQARADSVQEDAARLDWLDQQCEGYGFQDIHEGNRWEISGPYANVRQAIDYERAARKQGATQ